MEPPDPSFTDEFNVPQEYVVLVLDIRRAAVLLPFQVHCLQVLVDAGLITFPNACFEFADEGPEEAQHGSFVNLPNIFASHLCGLSKVAVVGVCGCRRLLASSLYCHAAFILASTPGSAY